LKILAYGTKRYTCLRSGLIIILKELASFFFLFFVTRSVTEYHTKFSQLQQLQNCRNLYKICAISLRHIAFMRNSLFWSYLKTSLVGRWSI